MSAERLPVICLLGKARSGKDTAGKLLAEAGSGVTIAFADKLKAICSEMFGLPREDFYTEEGKNRKTGLPCLRCPQAGCGSFRVQPWVPVDAPESYHTSHFECTVCNTVGEKQLFASTWTPRMIAQHIGTEGFRAVDPHVWPDYALRTARRELDNGKPLVIITDGRFRSECNRVWAAGGEVWRIKRIEADGSVGIAGHASETEQDTIADAECQAVIDNNGTVEELRQTLVTQLGQFWARRR